MTPRCRTAPSACTAIALLLLAMTAQCAFADNPTAAENRLTGTTAWVLQNAGAGGGCPSAGCGSNTGARRLIEGYASRTSYVAGDTLRIYVSCDETDYRVRIYRVGWYDGDGARLQFGPILRAGGRQPSPPPDPLTGLVDCEWSEPFEMSVPGTWVSGVYLAVLTSGQTNTQNYVIFVVREDARHSDLLVTLSTHTYQAYNCWGGKSLYAFSSTYCEPAVKVSYNRPYTQSHGAGDFFYYEIQLVRWLEREGYDVSYATNVDLHADSGLLTNHRALLSTAHDEYWTSQMRDHVEQSADTVSTAFLGGGSSFWQVRLEPDRLGRENRTLVGYKHSAMTRDPFALDSDPSNDSLITAWWRDPRVNRPEARMMGVQFDPLFNGEISMAQDLVVTGKPKWAFHATGASAGTHWFGLLGHECDRLYLDSPHWTEILARSAVTIGGLLRGYSDMAIVTRHNAIVFSSGTLQWSWALDDHPGVLDHVPMVNLGAQQLMRNVLYRMIHPVHATLAVPELAAAGTLRAWPTPYRGGSLNLSASWPGSEGSNELVLIDLSGRRLRTIELPANGAAVRWDGRDEAGRDVPSGIVLVRARARGTERVLKLIVMR